MHQDNVDAQAHQTNIKQVVVLRLKRAAYMQRVVNSWPHAESCWWVCLLFLHFRLAMWNGLVKILNIYLNVQMRRRWQTQRFFCVITCHFLVSCIDFLDWVVNQSYIPNWLDLLPIQHHQLDKKQDKRLSSANSSAHTTSIRNTDAQWWGNLDH